MYHGMDRNIISYNAFQKFIERSSFIDTRSGIKGTKIWLPEGQKIKRIVENKIHSLMSDFEYQEYTFPIFISEEGFRKEKDHIKGFLNESFQTNYGLFLRPTSEVPIYEFFSKSMKTYRQLPLKMYQIVNVYRKETKTTRSFFREREFAFFENHSIFETAEEALKGLQENQRQTNLLMDFLGFECRVHLRAKYDTFPGAEFTVAYDLRLRSGHWTQIATIHYLGKNFSKPFDIRIANKKEQIIIPHQTCYGMSERLVGSLLFNGIQADNTLVLPWSLAPTQVKLVNVKGSNTQRISISLQGVHEIIRALDSEVRVLTPKYQEMKMEALENSETQGIPLTILIGDQEYEQKHFSYVLRNKERGTLPLTKASIREVLERSREIRSDPVHKEEDRGFFCSEKCCQSFEENSSEGFTVLGQRYDYFKNCHVNTEMDTLDRFRHQPVVRAECLSCKRETDCCEYFYGKTF